MKSQTFFKYRNVWLGVAALWILLYHTRLEIPMPGFDLLRRLGYGGVDICLFASGVGGYFSLDKDPHVGRFLKRRLKRLAPAYLLFIAAWLVYKLATVGMPAYAVVGNLLGIQSLIGWDHHFNWYISALVLYYPLMPLLKKAVDKGNFLCQLGMLLLLTALSACFWNIPGYIVIAARLPVIYLGMLFGKMGRKEKLLGKGESFLFTALAGVGLLGLLASRIYLPDWLWNYGLYWYPFAMIVPGLCLLLSRAADFACRFGATRWVSRGLEWLGDYCFEIYLIQVPVFEIMKERSVQGNLWWLLGIGAVVLASLLLRLAQKPVKKLPVFAK